MVISQILRSLLALLKAFVWGLGSMGAKDLFSTLENTTRKINDNKNTGQRQKENKGPHPRSRRCLHLWVQSHRMGQNVFLSQIFKSLVIDAVVFCLKWCSCMGAEKSPLCSLPVCSCSSWNNGKRPISFCKSTTRKQNTKMAVKGLGELNEVVHWIPEKLSNLRKSNWNHVSVWCQKQFKLFNLK